MTRWKAWLPVLLIVAPAMAVRLWFAAFHFTQVDDVGVAGTLVAAADVRQVEELFLQKAGGDIPSSVRGALLKRVFESAAWKKAGPAVLSLYRFVAVPAEWTYAPAQFLVTALLVRPGQPYGRALLAGRLPSWLAGLAGILLTLAVARRFAGREAHPSGPLAAAALVAFSLEHALFSAHMSNYVLGSAGAALFLWLVLHAFRPAPRPWRRAVLHGLALGGLFLCHYQLLPLVLAFLGTRFVIDCRRKEAGPLHAVLAGALSGAVFAVVFLPVFVLRLSDMPTAHWNCGPSGEFLFQLAPGGILTGLLQAVRFFVVNGFVAFSALVSVVPEGSFLYPVLSAVTALLVLAGWIAMARSGVPERRALALFAALLALAWAGLVVTGKMALAPTRHNLVWLPLIALLAAQGLAALAKGRTVVSYGFCAAAGLLFLIGLPAFWQGRADLFNERMLAVLARQHRVDRIAGDDSLHNLRLMPALADLPRESINAPAPAEARVLVVLRYDDLETASDEGLRRLVGGRVVEVAYREGSDKEFEVSSRTRNGANSLAVYVLGPVRTATPSDPTS